MKSNRGKDWLLHEGYLYTKKRTNKDGSTIWLCEKEHSKKFQGKVSTQPDEVQVH